MSRHRSSAGTPRSMRAPPPESSRKRILAVMSLLSEGTEDPTAFRRACELYLDAAEKTASSALEYVESCLARDTPREELVRALQNIRSR